MANHHRQHDPDSFQAVYRVMLDPDEVTLTTLASGNRWATDGYTAIDLTTLGLAEAFERTPDAGGYQLRHNRPPVSQPFCSKAMAWRDPAAVAAGLKEHLVAPEGYPVALSPYTLAGDDGDEPRYMRFLTTTTTTDDGGVLVTVNGPAYDAWNRLLRRQRPMPNVGHGVELLPNTRKPITRKRLELGMLRWRAAGRPVGLLMAMRPAPFPLLPAALVTAAGTRREVTAATDALTDAAEHLRTAVKALHTIGLPELAEDIGQLAEQTEATTDRLTATN